MANELKKTYLTAINHIADCTLAIANAGFSTAANVTTAITSTNTSYYPYADVMLHWYCTVNPTAGATISLYRRDINIQGTDDAPEVNSGYKHKLVGIFVVDDASGHQRLMCTGVELRHECEFFIENNSGVAFVAGSGQEWDLDVYPWSFVPGS